MRDGHELDRERPQLHLAALRDRVQLDARRAGLVQLLHFEQADGEARRVDRGAEPAPQVGDGADVVLVRMRDASSR